MIEALPPPPGPDNQLRRPAEQQQGEEGIMIPFGMLKPLANWYTSLRPLAPFIMRMARIKVKIPPELDEAMAYLAASGNPEMLKRLAAGQQQTMDMERRGPGYYAPPQEYTEGEYEVPPDEPGSPVMTHDMAEEAYFLHTQKHMGSLQIAQHFAQHGSPVSKATVTRYIEDIRQEYEEQEEMHKQATAYRLRIGLALVGLWFASSVGLHYLLNFLHLL
jgi:hypothetical protein